MVLIYATWVAKIQDAISRFTLSLPIVEIRTLGTLSVNSTLLFFNV